MKFTTIFFSLIGVASVLVAASPAQVVDARSNEIDVREPSWDDETSLFLERSEFDDENSLGARYLDSNYELSEREYAEVEERFVQAILGVARTVLQVVNLIKGQIEKDKGVSGLYFTSSPLLWYLYLY